MTHFKPFVCLSCVINNHTMFPFLYLPRDCFLLLLNSQLVRWIVVRISVSRSLQISDRYFRGVLPGTCLELRQVSNVCSEYSLRVVNYDFYFLKNTRKATSSYQSITGWIDRSSNEANNRTFRRDSRTGERVKRKRNYASGAR